ncbi:MAG: hypothetical protein IH910_09790 [Proteobacteria bacterium]|nr:hypothetical protein [Pseudomonadota bacterium]
MIRKFKEFLQSPGAQVTDQLCPSEVRQAEFSYDFCYPLVPTVRNAVQIANKIAAHFKTEFFNRIGRKLPFKIAVLNLIECSVSVKADIQPGVLENRFPNDRFLAAPGSVTLV